MVQLSTPTLAPSATTHFVTDGETDRQTGRQTEDIMMTIADHAACQ